MRDEEMERRRGEEGGENERVIWAIWSSVPPSESAFTLEFFVSCSPHPPRFRHPWRGSVGWPWSWCRSTLFKAGLTKDVVWISAVAPPQGLLQGRLDPMSAFHAVLRA